VPSIPGGRPLLVIIVCSPSYTTISETMTEWNAARQVATAPLREPAPLAIAERLADLGADVWTIALELAGRRLKANREALENARAGMEAQKAEAVGAGRSDGRRDRAAQGPVCRL
jgi:colicin import membrane protein